MNHTNYFEFFNISTSIIIDIDELEEKYIAKQNDSNTNDDEKNHANQYYKILRNDVQRFEHFCDINKINLNTEVNQNFLFRFYELNEEIEEMDSDKQKSKLKELKNKLKTIFIQISDLHSQNEINKVLELYVEAKYINRILENYRK
jgi:hypothetical protein